MKRCARYLKIWLAVLVLMGSGSRALGQVRVVDRLETDGSSAVPRPNLRIEPGDTIYLAEPLAAGDHVQITVEAFTGSVVEDREVITLNAADGGGHTAGFVPTARRGDGVAPLAQAGDGTLQVRARNSIRFISASSGTGPDTTLVAERAQIALVTPDAASAPNAGAAGEIGTFRIGDRIFVRVIDDDRNQNPNAIEVIPPGVLNIRDMSNLLRDETPVLTETGPDTGVFVGSFPTAFVNSIGGATALNQLFEKTGSTPVEISYTDFEVPGPNAVPDPVITRQIPLEVGQPGAAVGAASPLVVGQPIQLTVTDPNLNPQALGEGRNSENPTQTVTVTVLARTAGNVVVDQETVVLGAAGAQTFRGVVPWVFGNAAPSGGQENGVVNIPPGGNVYLAYGTPLGTNGQPFQGVPPQNPVVPPAGPGSISFVTGADGATATSASQLVSPGETVYLRIVDTGLVSRPVPGTNSVTVTVNASGHPNPQVVVARELGGSPGTFVAAISTTLANPLQAGLVLQPDGTLHVRGNDQVTATYFDSGASAHAAANPPRVAVNGQVVIQEDTARGSLSLPAPSESGEIRRIRAGDSFLVVVRDDDRNVSTTTRDTVTVQVNVPGTAQSQTVTLTETDVDTGVFVARVATAFGLTANPAPGIINVNAVPATNAVNVEYDDPLAPIVPTAPNLAPNRFLAFLDVEAGVDGTLAVTPVITPASTLTITVSDSDLRANTRPGPGNDSVRVTVTSFSPSGARIDEESFDVPETSGGASSGGTFTLNTRVAFGGPALANDGVLTVQHLGSIRTAYGDALRANGETDAVVEVSSSTQFAGVAPAVAIVSSEDPAAPAVAQVEPGAPLYIRVTDADANLTAGLDTVSVTVFTGATAGAAGQDSEVVVLRETSATSGIFTGHVDTRFSSRGAFAANGIVEARGAGINPVISVKYQSPNGAAPAPTTVAVEGGVTGTLAMTPGSLAPGQRLNLAVSDTDVAANQHAGGNNDTVKVTIVSRASPGGAILDTETFDVPETSSPGTFVAAVPTAFDYAGNAGTPGDGVVTVANGGTVQATYSDALKATGATDAPVSTPEQPVGPQTIAGLPTVTFVTNLSGGTAATGPIDAGDTVYLEVVDPNANVTEHADTVTATVLTGNGGTGQDVETVTLRETAPSSGHFTGSIVTRAAATGAAPQNGQLEVRGRGPITPSISATYDPPPVGGPLTTSAALAVRPGSDGTVALSAGTLTPGGALTVTVIDDDRIANAHLGGGNDHVRVTLSSRDSTGAVVDEESLDVGEQSGAGGTFSARATIAFAYTRGAATPNDGVLQVVNGGTVRATYTDGLRANGDVDVAVTSADVPVGTISQNPTLSFRDGLDGGLTVSAIEPGDIVFVRVEDPNANVSPNRDTVNVSISTAAPGFAGDLENVVLQETQPSSGVFTGFIRTRLGANNVRTGEDVSVVRGNGQLEVRGRDTITGSYVSPSVFPTSPVAPIQVRTNAIVRFVQFAGSSAAPAERFLRAGDHLFVQVIDDNANTTAAPDHLFVTVRSHDAAGNAFDAVSLELVETGGSTGIFGIAPGARADTIAAIGEIANGTQSGLRTEDRQDRLAVANDGILQVVGGGRVTAEFTEQPRPAGTAVTHVSEELVVRQVIGSSAEARIRILPPGVGAPTSATSITGGDQFCVEVTDPNANRTARVDTVQVIAQVTQGSSGTALDSESIQLVETGGDTGVFVGCVSTNLGPRLINNGALTVAGNETITVSYGVLSREGSPTTISQHVLVTNQYSTTRTVSNLAADGTQLRLASGAQFSVPANAVHRPVDLTFNQRFGKTESDAAIVDTAGNAVPAPLNPQVRLARIAGRPFWFDVQPEGMHFLRPAELALPVPVDLQVVDPASGSLRAVTDSEKNTSLRIVYFDGMDWVPVGGRFVGLGSGPDPAQSFVVASVNHLSMFALALDTRPPPFVGGPLISGVALDNTTFTPNGDGANDATTLSFGLAEPSTVTVRIYDSAGEMIRTLIQDTSFSAGFGSTQWDGSYQFASRKVPAGLYIFEIKATTVTGTRSARETIMVGVMK